MFKGEEDEEEDGSIPISRYPCMPSLIALQQMRNRLHLARIGKKLMKWTALATGRELRKLAYEIDVSYKSFREDMCNAFMLLARARYFNPNLNKMVLENADRQAVVTVASSVGTVSGVKVLQLLVVESGAQPYLHLGIEKGGEVIDEAKVSWHAIVKKLVLILQLRTNFRQVEAANKTATKRKNVLMKIIIPRIRKSIQYIIAELEEIAREELYRIKKIKQKKLKDREKKVHKAPGYKCPICGYTAETIIDRINAEEEKPHKPFEARREESKRDTVELHDIRAQIEIPGDMYIPLSCQSKDSRKPLDTKNFVSIGEHSIDIRLDFLKKQLNKMISLSGNLISKGFENIDLNTFSKTCEDFELSMVNIFKTEEPTKSVDEHLKHRLEHLKSKLMQVTDVVREFRDESFLSPSVEKFVKTCEDTEVKINTCLKKIETNDVEDNVKIRLKELSSYIDNVVNITEECKDEELLTSSVNDFLTSCKLVKLKINKYLQENGDLEQQRIDHLKEHVSDLEHLAIHVKQEGIATSSLENLIASCKDFKAKIEEYKKRDKNLSIDKLMNHIDDTIELSRDVKDKGLMSDSIENFIKSCEDIKKKIEIKGKVKTDVVHQPKALSNLRYNIDDIMNIISKSKEQGLLIPSVEDFIKSCEKTKAKINLYERFPIETDSEGKMLYPTCSETCTCGTTEVPLDELCDKCSNFIKEEVHEDDLPPPPCDFCRGLVREEPSEELLCDSCNQIHLEEEEIGFPAYVSPEQSQDHVCDICKKHTEEGVEECNLPKEEEAETETVDSTLGYFEKKVRKITRVKRIQNLDGTIREEKETILIRKEKHDPNETTITDDEAEFEDVSYDSLLDDTKKDTKKVGICIARNQNRQGFMPVLRYVQSEIIPGVSTMAGPNFRECISELTRRHGSRNLATSSSSCDALFNEV